MTETTSLSPWARMAGITELDAMREAPIRPQPIFCVIVRSLGNSAEGSPGQPDEPGSVYAAPAAFSAQLRWARRRFMRSWASSEPSCQVPNRASQIIRPSPPP